MTVHDPAGNRLPRDPAQPPLLTQLPWLEPELSRSFGLGIHRLNVIKHRRPQTESRASAALFPLALDPAGKVHQPFNINDRVNTWKGVGEVFLKQSRDFVF